jgi:hypothetical protein
MPEAAKLTGKEKPRRCPAGFCYRGGSEAGIYSTITLPFICGWIEHSYSYTPGEVKVRV